ncbi:conserved hypothetical protein [Vibrio nigripulchritudo SFn27]|uniref:Uncharacterized protein n=1 Tax=Vibrio nigripulchritudo TaxID=28173 RepID=U4KHD3_9VIBR|nr:hypothetical protein [Vibrio nigripulchritudo]CCN80686.1 conserved hypothetical protein [Vibrio nigripulchritudo BLFn1]CCN90028.1 conserved hypothetical protein [Vibrio nigripulchritudo SFn27]CCN93372.1 conserved hypothetical protein [Vibrio nigripulchritudo ENn2]CCO42198.1 conserved hypothetical protein [Vibrio nigripulchritudo SFn135]CCO55267.1 conserved hypothetical protein [Vibrio nigripulchritudo Wn13]
MRTLKIWLSIVSLFLLAFSAWLFMPAISKVEKQVLEQDLAEPFRLVGYRVISTDPSIDATYHYYLTVKDSDIDEESPFLITSDPFIKVDNFDDNSLHISVTGKIELYRNDLWVKKDDEKLHHWYISMQSKYIR